MLNILAITFGTLAAVILIHEAGHYVAARAVGIPVLKFSVGSGPLLLQIRDRRGCTWSFHLVPLSGLCRYAPRWWLRPLWQQLMTIAGGPLANLVTALLIAILS